jgi:hypothetical protein
LDTERKKLNEIASEIDEIKKHPIKRQGGDLLKLFEKKIKLRNHEIFINNNQFILLEFFIQCSTSRYSI